MPAKRKARIANTIADLIRATGASRSAVYRWRGRGWIATDPPWNVDEVIVAVHAARARARNDAAPDAPAGPLTAPGAGSGDELRDARIQNEKLRAAIRALELKRLRGELIARDQVQNLLDTRMRIMRRSLMAVGRRLARQLVNRPDPAEVQAEIDEEHERILWQIYGRPPDELEEAATDDARQDPDE